MAKMDVMCPWLTHCSSQSQHTAVTVGVIYILFHRLLSGQCCSVHISFKTGENLWILSEKTKVK